MKFKWVIGLLLTFNVACSSVTIDLKKDPAQKLSDNPTLTDYRSYYFWGLLQSKHVSVGKACLGQPALKLRSYASLEDVLLTGITFGIYTSRTVEVWCAAEVQP